MNPDLCHFVRAQLYAKISPNGIFSVWAQDYHTTILYCTPAVLHLHRGCTIYTTHMLQCLHRSTIHMAVCLHRDTTLKAWSYIYIWDTSICIHGNRLKCTLALGSSLTTAAHIICFALSAYLRTKQKQTVSCKLTRNIFLTCSLSIVHG